MQAQRAAALLTFLLAGLLVSCVGAAGSPTPPVPTASPASSPTLAALPTPSSVASPSPALDTYVVASGDTFSQIAAHFGVTVEALLALNPSIGDPNLIAVGQAISVPVRSVGTAIRIEGPDYRHLRLRESANLVVIGDLLLAGETVQWQLAEAPSKPATWPSGSVPWRSAEQAWIDVDGRSFPILAEYLNAYDEGDRQGRHVWRAYRGIVPATATHPELWTQTVVVEWGGTGPCPDGITSWGEVEVLVAPDGTTYDVVHGEDTEHNSQWSIVASNIKGKPETGWTYLLEPCWYPYELVVGKDATAYLSAVYRTGEPPPHRPLMRLIVAGPEGIRSERGLEWAILERAPDGTVFAIRTEAPAYSDVFISMTVAALDPHGNAKPGWPFATTDLTSWPVYGPDGTVYVAQTTDAGDWIIALGPDGKVKEGWPYPVPGKLEWTVCGAGCADVPRWPQVSPDGSIYDSFDSGIYIVGPDGQAKDGWPYVLPKGTSIPNHLGTPGWSAIAPAIGRDGRVYVPWYDERSGTPHYDLICLSPGGTICPGWPVRVPQRAAREIEIDERGIVHAWLADDPGAPASLELEVRPDGTVVHEVEVGDTISGIAAAYGVTRVALLRANPQVTDPSLIHPGDVLVIPQPGTEP